MGVTSHILSTFARKPIFGYRAMVYAMAAIGFLGFMVWGHHMFVSGMSPYSGFAFSILTMAIGVPSAIKTFNWIGTLLGATHSLRPPPCFTPSVLSRIFVSGGLCGIFLGQPPIDIYFHDTYFVLAHFHLIMGVAAIFGMFAGTVLLVPQNVRPHDERDGGEDSFLDYLRRRLRHLHAHALPGPGRQSPALLGVHRQFPVCR